MTPSDRIGPTGPVPKPTLTSVPRLIAHLAARQPVTLLGGIAFGAIWMLCQVAWPYLLGRAIDEGVTGRLRDVLPWLAALAGVAAAQALATALRHRMAVTNWLTSSLTISRLVGHHSASTGYAMTADTALGEIVATVSSDALRMGEMFDVTARLSGSVIAYGVVGVVLFRESQSIGLVAVAGVPLLGTMLLAFLRPLQRRQWRWRRETGRLMTLGADTVAGLRVLRGVGGEDVFVQRYAAQSQRARGAGIEVARLASWTDGLQVLLPGLLVAALLWAGARLVLSGSLSPGEFVTVYGYATFLMVPLRTGVEAAQAFTRGVVAARRVLAVLRIEPAVREPSRPAEPPARGVPLVDVASGIVVEPGRLTAIVDPDADESARLGRRLGRFDDREHRDAPVLWGGTELTGLSVRDIRRRIVVSVTTPHLFAGRLIDNLVPAERSGAVDRGTGHQDRSGTADTTHGAAGDRGTASIQAALASAAVASEVAALPAGVESAVDERGRNFSGGQRQRLSLARALLTDAEILVLIEPTSAVDAHTEALIADGVRALRDGRTTVVVTESPLVLDRADIVHVVENGRLVVSGRHRDLMRREDEVGRRYRAVVARAEGPAPVRPCVENREVLS